MTDEEFEKYLEKHQQNFKGNREHLRVLMEKGLLKLDLDLSEYPDSPKGGTAQVLTFDGSLDDLDWNKWRKENKNIIPDLKGINLSKENGGILLFSNFENANLESANLENTCIQSANFKKANLYHANLFNANFRNTDLEEANLRGADLTEAELAFSNFKNADLAHVNFSGANLWYANLEGADLNNANLEKANVFSVKYNNKTECRGLNASTSVGNALFKRFAEDQEFIKQISMSHKIIYWLWKVSCNCGRSLSLWAAWSLFFATGFGLIYYILGNNAFHLEKLKWSLETMIYYSVVTFTTLGFGDIYPKTSLAARFVMIEVILGYIMLGGLISIFSTKLARRS